MTRRFALLTAALALLAACSNAAPSSPSPSQSHRSSSPARIKITSPRNGEVIHGSSVPLRISLEGARIVKPTTTNIDPRKGHVHVYLDGKIVSMNFALDARVNKVTPGTHLLKVEFVASDHLPFDPRILDATSFEVKK